MLTIFSLAYQNFKYSRFDFAEHIKKTQILFTHKKKFAIKQFNKEFHAPIQSSFRHSMFPISK